jgi:diguanylate cyclase (GGDEF)-like protein
MSELVSTVRSWIRSEDHYYWLTSELAAGGLQRATSRLIATNLLGLGAISLIMLLSEQGPSGSVNRLLSTAVSICCIAMATLWLRHSWPTRWQSQLCVMLGSVCVAVACLIEPHPALGLFGASAFTVVSAFTAFFHAGRLLAFPWTVGSVTLVILATRLGDFDPVVTACVVALFVLTNVFVVFMCRSVMRVVATDSHYGELDPLTGLLTRDAFSDRVATIISRGRADDRFLAFVVVSIDSFSMLTAINGVGGANQARVAIGHRIAETLRHDAVLAHVGESEYLIADTFTSADASVLSERLRHTVRTAPFRLTASIGVVTTPLAQLVGVPAHDVVDELVTLATSNMYVARRAGGHRTEATECWRLASVDGANADDIDDDPLANGCCD